MEIPQVRRYSTPIKDVRYAFTWDEIQSMLKIAEVNPRTYALMTTLAYSGRRISEVVGEYKRAMVKVYWCDSEGKKDKTKWQMVNCAITPLTADRIDFNNNVITWCIAKKVKKKNISNDWQEPSRISVILEAHPKLLEVLKNYIDTEHITGSDRIFKFQRQYAYKLIRAVFDKSGIIDRRRIVHAFRHGFSIELIHGADAEAVMDLSKLLVHDSTDTTMGYLVFANSDKKKLLGKLK